MPITYITIEEVLRLHFQVIEDFGGRHGIRDENRLKSLAHSPGQEVFGVEQYQTIYEKAAAYIRNIIGDHPFTDGNKRTSIIVAGVFLMRNGFNFKCSTKQLEEFAVKVAVDKLSISVTSDWLEDNISSTN